MFPFTPGCKTYATVARRSEGGGYLIKIYDHWEDRRLSTAIPAISRWAPLPPFNVDSDCTVFCFNIVNIELGDRGENVSCWWEVYWEWFNVKLGMGGPNILAGIVDYSNSEEGCLAERSPRETICINIYIHVNNNKFILSLSLSSAFLLRHKWTTLLLRPEEGIHHVTRVPRSLPKQPILLVFPWH